MPDHRSDDRKRHEHRRAEEIKELRAERKMQFESQQKLEQFIVHALAREIKEFAQDKQAVVEALGHKGKLDIILLQFVTLFENQEKLKNVNNNMFSFADHKNFG
jgi:uncharacterized protein YecE (DUF72 family)